MNTFREDVRNGEFRIQIKAESMLLYTVKTVSNTKYFPNWMRGSLVRIILDHATGIFDSIAAANATRDIDVRMEWQQKALQGCAQMLGLIDMCERDGLIKMDKALKWSRLVMDVRYMTTAWARITTK